MADRWSRDPQYSHGYLVPILALFLLWMHRERFPRADLGPRWGAVILLAAGCALRFAGMYLYIGWVEMASLLPVLGGFCVLVGGWRLLRWAWPGIAFLLFMIHLPYRLHQALGEPLQQIATAASGFALQTLGLPAVPEGNTILVRDCKLDIVEACSGLSTLLVFFAISTFVAVVIRRPLADKLLVVLSAVPIAVVSNVVRITATGLLYVTMGEAPANFLFHDLSGWLMMPLAIAMLCVELRLLSWLLVEERVPGLFASVPLAHDAGRVIARGDTSHATE
jgi:exosortase